MVQSVFWKILGICWEVRGLGKFWEVYGKFWEVRSFGEVLGSRRTSECIVRHIYRISHFEDYTVVNPSMENFFWLIVDKTV